MDITSTRQSVSIFCKGKVQVYGLLIYLHCMYMRLNIEMLVFKYFIQMHRNIMPYTHIVMWVLYDAKHLRYHCKSTLKAQGSYTS